MYHICSIQKKITTEKNTSQVLTTYAYHGHELVCTHALNKKSSAPFDLVLSTLWKVFFVESWALFGRVGSAIGW